MMGGVEPDEPLNDQIDGNNDVEEPRHDQNENAGNECNNGRKFGGGDDHDLPRRWIDFGAIAQVQAEIDKLSTPKTRFGSSMMTALGNRQFATFHSAASGAVMTI